MRYVGYGCVVVCKLEDAIGREAVIDQADISAVDVYYQSANEGEVHVYSAP